MKINGIFKYLILAHNLKDCRQLSLEYNSRIDVFGSVAEWSKALVLGTSHLLLLLHTLFKDASPDN